MEIFGRVEFRECRLRQEVIRVEELAVVDLCEDKTLRAREIKVSSTLVAS